MILRWQLVVLMLVLAVLPALSRQTPTELRQRYAPSVVERYRVRPGIVVTVSYAEDGQVCEMVIEPGPRSTSRPARAKYLPSNIVTDVINELVPADERGRRGRSITFTSSCNEIRSDEYGQLMISHAINACTEEGASRESSVWIRWKTAGCQRAEILGRHVDEGLHDLSISEAVSRLLYSEGLSGGIVVMTPCRGTQSHASIRSGLTLGEALDAITLDVPQYRWELEDRVINLIPSAGDPPLLDVPIAELNVAAETVTEALGQLLATAEVRRRAAELSLSQAELGLSLVKQSPLSRAGFRSGLRVQGQDITLREALNAIARASGLAVWAYAERDCDGRDEFSIKFLVR